MGGNIFPNKHTKHRNASLHVSIRCMFAPRKNDGDINTHRVALPKKSTSEAHPESIEHLNIKLLLSEAEICCREEDFPKELFIMHRCDKLLCFSREALCEVFFIASDNFFFYDQCRRVFIIDTC